MLTRIQAEEMIRDVVDAFNSGDIDRIMALFEPDVMVHWNGQKVASNWDELKVWFLAGPVGQTTEFRIEKSLQVTDGNTFGVHWRHFATYRNGQSVQGFGNEFWTNRNGRAAAWNAVGVEIPR